MAATPEAIWLNALNFGVKSNFCWCCEMESMCKKAAFAM